MAEATDTQSGTPNLTFNLVSVLYHQLQQAQTLGGYVADAEQAGDDALAGFFKRCIAEAEALSDEAKELLRERIQGTASRASKTLDDDELADEGSKLSFPASDVPAY